MSTVLATLSRFLAPEPFTQRRDPVQQLLERAGARAGRNPGQASELRSAALAWLRVVR